MKRYFILCLLASAILALSSCEDILDKDPTDKLSQEETFKDLDGVKTALSGAYSSLRALEYYQRNMMVYPELAGGNIKYLPSKTPKLYDLYTFTQDATTSSGTETYKQIYSILHSVNNIIKYTPTTLYATDQEKNQVLAEAKALRALLHFDLVKLFARPYTYTSDASHPGVVINLHPRLYSDPLPKRATIAETYAAITADLEEARVLFDNSGPVFSGRNNKAYINKNIATALLAKVYLFKADWQKAYTLADEIIKSNQYQLLTNEKYAASWETKNSNPESVFELVLESNFSGTSLGNHYAPGFTEQMFATTEDLLSLYTATDIRSREKLFNKTTWQGNTYYFTRKYGQGGTASTNIKMLRLAELYLIRAEAAAELNDLPQANQDLNTIILRADTAATQVDYTNKTALLHAILLERRKELAFEGNLHFDLMRRKQAIVRTDCDGALCNLAYTDNRTVLPIPKETINTNPEMQQNPGY